MKWLMIPAKYGRNDLLNTLSILAGIVSLDDHLLFFGEQVDFSTSSDEKGLNENTYITVI